MLRMCVIVLCHVYGGCCPTRARGVDSTTSVPHLHELPLTRSGSPHTGVRPGSRAWRGSCCRFYAGSAPANNHPQLNSGERRMLKVTATAHSYNVLQHACVHRHHREMRAIWAPESIHTLTAHGSKTPALLTHRCGAPRFQPHSKCSGRRESRTSLEQEIRHRRPSAAALGA